MSMRSSAGPVQDSNNERQKGHGSEGILLLVPLALIVLFVVRYQLSILQPDPMPSPGVRAVASSSHVMAPLSTSSPPDSAGATNDSAPTDRGDSSADSTALPVYLLHSAANRTARAAWGSLAERWNRTAQYADLFEAAADVAALPPARSTQRPVLMIHCTPKTGSTTLRRACRDTLEATCGVSREAHHKRKGARAPVGYENETELYRTIRNCSETTHFCLTGITMPVDVPAFTNAFFLHLFPFRNYDEWAASALKQQYDRGHERACNETKWLLERCKPNRMEIDLGKYAKARVADFRPAVMRRMREKGEEHVFLLYHHAELHETLARLSALYGVPGLPGTGKRLKGRRPEGTCDDETLRMYHDCFSGQLMELL